VGLCAPRDTFHLNQSYKVDKAKIIETYQSNYVLINNLQSFKQYLKQQTRAEN